MRDPFISYQSLFREVMDLMVATKGHLQTCDLTGLIASSRIRHSVESVRLTAVLVDAMNWLRGWAAFADGTISRERQMGDFGLRASAISRRIEPDLPPGLEELAGLLRRSCALYERIERLDLGLKDSGQRDGNAQLHALTH